jgi:hypothetical protein
MSTFTTLPESQRNAGETQYSKDLAKALRRWANEIAKRYDSPVYLVGSALTKPNPRDVDVIVILSDEAFFKRYGCNWFEAVEKTGTNWVKWNDEMIEVFHAFTIPSILLDFKVESISWSDILHPTKPAIRIDEMVKYNPDKENKNE